MITSEAENDLEDCDEFSDEYDDDDDDEIYEEEIEDELSISPPPMIQKFKNNPNLTITPPPSSPDDLPQNINDFSTKKFPANNRKTHRGGVKRRNKFSPNNAQ